MSLFDDVKKRVTDAVTRSKIPGAGESAGHARLLSGALELLSGQGGFGALVQSFKDKGLSEVVSSWIGTGKNLPVSPEQIQSVLGSEKIKQMADKAGISPQEAAAKLSTILPEVVDKATPNGKFDANAILQQGVNLPKNKIS